MKVQGYSLKVKKTRQKIRNFYTAAQGLPSDAITAAAFDGKGVLWVGTDKGLAKFDGKKFAKFDVKAGNGNISMLHVDKEGALYVGTENKLVKVKDSKIVSTTELEGNIIAGATDYNGIDWFITDRYLYTNYERGTLYPYHETETPDCKGLAAFNEDFVFAAGSFGLQIIHGKRPRWATLITQTSKIPTNELTAIAADTWNHVWIGTKNGALIFDGRNRWLTPDTVKALPRASVTTIAIVKNGAAYIGTEIGLYIIDGTKESFLGYNRWLPDFKVTAIAVSSDSDTLCIGTEKGLAIIEFKLMSLSEKAEYYQYTVEKYHNREGYTTNRQLTEKGNIESGAPQITDNDGLWTGCYVASQALRYGATKDKKALESARKGMRAMLKLMSITGIEGFTARAYRRPGEPGFGDGDKEWHLTEDEFGPLEWKGETSSDEMTGHFFGLSLYYDLCADEKEKKEIALALSNIMDHILSHEYTLCDVDGLPTTWAHWGPHELNNDEKWFWERGINSLELLAFLKIVYHMTGDEKYQKEYEKLIRTQNYALNCVQYKIFDAHTSHIDDNLGFLSMTSLLRYEQDPTIRQYFLMGFKHHWNDQRIERSPLWNIMYGALTGEHCDLENAVRSLEELPLDLIHHKVVNSVRPEIVWDSGQELFGGVRQLKEPLPYDEKPMNKYDNNPFLADRGDGLRAEDGTVFLLPYWYARYYGMIIEE